MAGFLGALTGLGGGVVIVPMLALAFGVDMRYAIGASLISVIATSSGAASAYVKEGYANIRIGMLLEVATTVGALSGAIVASFVPTGMLAVVFGVVLLYSAYASLRRHSGDGAPMAVDPLATRWNLDGTYPTSGGPIAYHVTRVPGGFAVMYVAGIAVGFVGDRLGRRQGAGHGSDHADSLQSLHDNQQLHDRRDGCCQRGHLFRSWLY